LICVSKRILPLEDNASWYKRRKWLLEAEGGKGTNVLFGDGHVEWVMVRALNLPKARALSGEARRQ